MQGPSENKQRHQRRENVDVYNGVDFIGEVGFRLLIRFSETAAAMFPPPSQLPGRQPIRGKKQFRPALIGVDNPTGATVQAAIKWMNDNEEADERNNGRVTLFAPPGNLATVHFLTLLDYYQASLLFGMRPYPWALRHEVYRRVSDEPPSLLIVREVAQYIPVDDPAMTRLISSIYDHDHLNHYTKVDFGHIGNFLYSRPQLSAMFEEIFTSKYLQGLRERLTAQGYPGGVNPVAGPSQRGGSRRS